MRMMMVLLVAVFVGCGSPVTAPMDASSEVDASEVIDAWVDIRDSGVDSGVLPDGGPGDSGSEPDASQDDASVVPDSGMNDAGLDVEDSGTYDAGSDTGVADSGPPDAGQPILSTEHTCNWAVLTAGGYDRDASRARCPGSNGLSWYYRGEWLCCAPCYAGLRPVCENGSHGEGWYAGAFGCNTSSGIVNNASCL